MDLLSDEDRAFVHSLVAGLPDEELIERKLLSMWSVHKATWQVAVRQLAAQLVVRQLTEHTAPSLPQDFLRQRSGIYRLWGSATKPGEDWPEAEQCLTEVDGEEYDALVKRMLSEKKDVSLRKNPVGGSTCFSYDICVWENDDHHQYAGIDLHFNNTMPPQSPFKHLDVLREELKDVAKVAKNNEANFLFCVSWLNTIPAFLDLFPASYRASALPMLQAPPETGEDGEPLKQPWKDWYFRAFEASTDTGRLGLAINRTGQFFQADWSLREKDLRSYLKTGSFPRDCLMCVCPAEDFIAMYGE